MGQHPIRIARGMASGYAALLTGTLTLQANGGQPVPDAAIGVPYELILNVTNSSNLITWSVLSPLTGPTVSSRGTTTGLFTCPSPTPQGSAPPVIQAVDTPTAPTSPLPPSAPPSLISSPPASPYP